MYLLGFPLLIIPFAIYNIVALILAQPDTIWTTEAYSVPMTSGEVWKLTWEDIIVAGSILLLWVEVIKSTRIGVRAIIDHVLSMVLFVAMLVEFLLVKAAGTSAFFLLLIISLVDVLAGFIISIRSSQRQVEVENTAKI
ncbi:MAG TPA: hypothetical protein VMF32_02815 [Xanthobacteraceae bacterium]|nr:hypothetical protein [Xanthobacteraceae bacterium]